MKEISFFDIWLAIPNIKKERRSGCLYEHLVESYPRLTLMRYRPVWDVYSIGNLQRESEVQAYESVQA